MKPSFNHSVVWMLPMFGLPDKRFPTVYATITSVSPHLGTSIKYLKEYRFSVHQDFMLVAVFCTKEGECN
jgi:hypothetical protein